MGHTVGARIAQGPTHVSIVSFWEIVIKARLGKFRVRPAAIRAQVSDLGWTVLGIEPSHLAVLETLPTRHKDPFDHLLIAQTIAENLTLVTDDRQMARYGIGCIPC